MADININQIKYLDDKGLKTLWEKISDTFLRDSEVISALTTHGEGQIITAESDTFIQKGLFDSTTTSLLEKIEDIEAAQGTNIDNDTIINVDNKLQTNLILHNDATAHTLSIITGTEKGGKGTVVSTWDYTDFYNEAVKDGILDTVSLVVVPGDETTEASGQEAGTYLKFVFNTASGKNPLYVNVSDLIDVYAGSTYIEVTKTGDSSTINLNTTELVDYLITDEALGINSIISRLEGVEDQISGLETLVTELQSAWEALDITGIQEQIDTNTSNISTIFTYLETVPNTPITDQEIIALE